LNYFFDATTATKPLKPMLCQRDIYFSTTTVHRDVAH
jgi:hypothetical protein